MHSRSVVGGAAFVAIAISCSSSQHTPAAPVSADFGVFHVTALPDNAKLTIAAGGSPLWEGLDASGRVGNSTSDNDDAPPMTGFAVRDVSTSYVMLYGAFKIVDAPSANWRIATSARWKGGVDPVTLTDGNGHALATLAFSATDDPNHLTVDVQPGDGPERRFSWGFKCNPDDHFLGFGEQTTGVDQRGETIPIWVSEEGVHKDLTTDNPTGAWYLAGRRHSTYMPMPEFLSNRGYAAVAQTDLLSTFSMCGESADVARMQVQLPAKLHLFFGPKPIDALTRKTAVFGRPRVPPDFAFAPWNDAIYGSANVRRVAKVLRDNGVPSSVIWTEDWRGAAFDGPDHYALDEEWDVSRALYPDFEAVAGDLHAAGFKWLVYFNSFVEKRSKAWPETAPKGYLIKGTDGQPYIFTDAKFNDTSLVDLSNPDAMNWAAGKMKASIALGADGWMGDFAEWLPADAVTAEGPSLPQHNRYPVLWQQAQRQAIDTVGDKVERLDFVRSGWFGTPQLADVFWPGDQQTDWAADDGLPTVLPMALCASISGISTFGSDIAGYQNINSPASDKELFFRWTELGAYNPVMRTHHGSYPKKNWTFESDAETLAHWTRYAKLHVALAPYFRTLAQQAHDTGIAIMRPLGVMFPDDLKTWPISDEFMLGPGLLVAPVQVPGTTLRKVYLPAGTWYPIAGGAPLQGTQIVDVNTPMGEIPVYALAGAIVPHYPDGVQTLTVEPSSAQNANAMGARVVSVYLGQSGSFTEKSGPSYVLTSSAVSASTDAVTATYSGAVLTGCAPAPVAPCAQQDANGLHAHVTGPGTLVVTRTGNRLAQLEIKSAAADAKLRLDLSF